MTGFCGWWPAGRVPGLPPLFPRSLIKDDDGLAGWAAVLFGRPIRKGLVNGDPYFSDFLR